MNKEKFQTSIFMITLMVILLSTGFVTYAYFTARSSNLKTNPMNVSSASIGQAFSTSGTLMELHITGEDTLQGKASAIEPSIVVENIMPIEVAVETAERDGTLTCYYDIVYVAIEPYLNSLENPGDAKELVIKGTEKNFEEVFFEEVMINNITSSIVLKENIKIEASGIKAKTTHSWKMEVGFYNQVFDQTDNQLGVFSGDIEIRNLRCDNFVNKQ